MNTIFTYQQTSEFSDSEQSEIDKIPFSQIPEMIVVETEIGEGEEMTILKTIPFQADVDEADFDTLKSYLENHGTVDIIGKWNSDGSIIEFSISKYRNALRKIQEFEQAIFLNGEDFTGREDEFEREPLLDENDEPVLDTENVQIFKSPSRRSFTREKSSRIPTLAEAKQIHVNVFDNKFIRQLV